MKVTKVSTDNGSHFTERFTAQRRTPTGQHFFDGQCTDFGIEHRRSPPRHPQTDGMVERFNGRVAEVIKQTRFASAIDLEMTLKNCVAIYNHRISQRALKHLSPILAMQQAARSVRAVCQTRLQPGGT